ncbi:MAG: tripartite tricarboxylate transporter TctB family protein [bacterium]
MGDENMIGFHYRKRTRFSQDKYILELIKHRLSDSSSYHDRKENMLYAGILLQTTLFGFILNERNWSHLFSLVPSTLVLAIIYFVFWFLLHLYIRKQQRFQRWASRQYNAYFNAHLSLISQNNKKKDVRDIKNESKHNKLKEVIDLIIPSKLKKVLDIIIPFPSAEIDSDIDIQKVGYPLTIEKHLIKQRNDPTKGAFSECLIAYSSIAILFISMLYLYSNVIGIPLNTNSNYKHTPIKPISLIANVTDRNVDLIWQTKAETNSYDINIEKCKISTNQINNWTKTGFIERQSNSNSLVHHYFTLQNLSNGIYLFRLKLLENNKFLSYSNIIKVVINIPPTEYCLSYYQSLLSSQTINIKYSLPHESIVNVSLINYKGGIIKAFYEGENKSGDYVINMNVESFKTGVYLIILKTVSLDRKSNNKLIKKILLVNYN